MFAAATGVEPVPLSVPPPTLHGIHYLLSSSMTPARDTHLLGIITHFRALSAIIAPSCYAASLYSLSNCLSLSKSRFVGGRGRIRTSFILSNMHQSSVVIRASPIAPLPYAGLSRLSSQEPQSALWFSLIMFISFNLFSLLRTLTHSGAFGCMWWSTVHPRLFWS